jgi:hypothetical protein
MRYPHVHSMADAGQIILGPVGREVFGFAQLLFLVFLVGSHILTFSIMMNTLTDHGTCTIVFEIVGMIVSILCTLPRTLRKVSWFSVACEYRMTAGRENTSDAKPCATAFISVFSAVMITMVAIGIEHPGKSVKATVNNSFYKAFLAVTDIVFAFGAY